MSNPIIIRYVKPISPDTVETFEIPASQFEVGEVMGNKYNLDLLLKYLIHIVEKEDPKG